MRFRFSDTRMQKKISEFMLENDNICMNDLLGYVCNHLSHYPSFDKAVTEFKTENGKIFKVKVEIENEQ